MKLAVKIKISRGYRYMNILLINGSPKGKKATLINSLDSLIPGFIRGNI